MQKYTLPILPLSIDLQTKPVLIQLNKSSRALAELKGEAKTIPNERILLNTLGLQEAKDSSAVENIITTNDELFRAGVDRSYANPAAKEVSHYVSALIRGFEDVRNSGLLTNRTIKSIQQELEQNHAGFRKLPGTTLKNSEGVVVYTPPQDRLEIQRYMVNLEEYINDPSPGDPDPLIKMTVIHHQFESIHPFYDGNGRTGRIINILYLVKSGLLDIPVLYLSRYIIHHKMEYYQHLQSVRETENWEQWVVFMLTGVEKTAYQTISLIKSIRRIMDDYKNRMRAQTTFYRKELLENLFQHPYTKISIVEQALGVHRNTASVYLATLARLGLVEKIKLGRSNYYINVALFDLLKQGLAGQP